MFEFSENNFDFSPFSAYLEPEGQLLHRLWGMRDNLPLPEWTSVHVHICGGAGDVYTEMDAGTCTVTHCDGAQPHKCDVKLEYI